MATNSDRTVENQLTCSICVETYKQPRYLPSCGHTFCETCLFKHVRNSQQDTDERRSSFRCPECRKPHSIPEDEEVTLQWIQTYPLNTAIIKMLPKVSELSNDSHEERRSCDPCRDEGEICTGSKFCLDCGEILCETCAQYHRKFKSFKGHKLSDITDLPQEVDHKEYFRAATKCQNHSKEEIDFFCKSHMRFVCSFCIPTGHKTCEIVPSSCQTIDVSQFEDASNKAATHIEDILENIDRHIKIRTDNKRSIKRKLADALQHVKQKRDQLVQQMDKVVENVSNITKQLELETENTADETVSKIAVVRQQAERNNSVLKTVLKQGSAKHKYVSSQFIIQQCEEIESQMSGENDELTIFDVELKFADCVQEFLRYDVDKLVEVTLVTKEDNHEILDAASDLLSDRECTIIPYKNSKVIVAEEHTVRPNADCEPCFDDIDIFEDGRIVLTDWCEESEECGYLCVFNPVDGVTLKLKSNCPYTVTKIDDTHVAFCYREAYAVSIVAVGDEFTMEKTLPTPFKPGCLVALKNGQLAVSWSSPPAFGLVDISGTEISHAMYFEQDKHGRKFKSLDYFAVDERRQHVIQPCLVDNVVYCFDFTGEPVFSYSHSELTAPQGVTVDRNGHIYICDYSAPGNIHKISPTGKPINIFKEGIPNCPMAICYDISRDGFWVTHDEESHREQVVLLRLISSI